MMDENLVWYASYGSNLLRSRFLCYIRGGKPEGANRTYQGCSNKKLPQVDKPILMPHQLYFSKNSSIWEGKAVAFIDPEKNPDATTFGRMYLITQQQFIEVVQQENARAPGVVDEIIKINFKELISNGKRRIDANWYDCIIYLGDEEEHPIFTFTSSCTLDEVNLNTPGEKYLKVIIKGIKETFKKSNKEIVDYIKNQPGVKGEITKETIKDLLGK